MSFIGRALPRREDERLVQGLGRYAADHNQPDQAYLAVLRSPYSHARIRRIDVEAARGLPGVLLVRTGHDYAAAGLGLPRPKPVPLGPVSRLREGVLVSPPNCVLPMDRVRYIGEPVAFAVGESEAAAQDAVERIVVEYEPLPPVVDLDQAATPDAALVWDDAPGNVCCELEVGDATACAAAFRGAAHVVSIEAVNNRITGCPMEPRAAFASFDAASGALTLVTGTQVPNSTRNDLADEVFKLPRERLRVLSPDMGGGFGTRSQTFPELIFVLWCARDLRRPVKWTGSRSDMFMGDPHARDNVSRGWLALDGDGRILGLKVETLTNHGAYPAHGGPLVPVSVAPRVQTGVYRVPALYADIKVVFTTTSTVGPYRGAGQPESVYLIERLLDLAALETGLDRVDIRRRNILAPDEFPYRTAAGEDYDSGDYGAAMTTALHLSDWAGFETRRRAARARGRLRGIGISNHVTVSGHGPFEWGRLIIRPDGIAEFRVGTHSHGQGHETSYAQILASELQLPLERVVHVQGDTDRVAAGTGTFGSRSLYKAGQVIGECTTAVIAKAKRLAALRFGIDAERLHYVNGEVRVPGTNFAASLFELSEMAAGADDLPEDLQGPLAAEVHHSRPVHNNPNGTHVCEVEIDPETGRVEIAAYSAVDDAGRLINPLICQGQMHGGIAQGVGQALWEHVVYDAPSGQLLTGSYMDYGVARADDLPAITAALQEVASPTNPLGLKGVGEGGPTGAPAAVISAIVDALRDYGVRHIDMPATPERIWRAIAAAP